MMQAQAKQQHQKGGPPEVDKARKNSALEPLEEE